MLCVKHLRRYATIAGTVPNPTSAGKRYLRKLAGKLDIKNADERIQIKTRQCVLQSEEFKSLWDRIKNKTTYRVQFDNNKLLENCAKQLEIAPYNQNQGANS